MILAIWCSLLLKQSSHEGSWNLWIKLNCTSVTGNQSSSLSSTLQTYIDDWNASFGYCHYIPLSIHNWRPGQNRSDKKCACWLLPSPIRQSRYCATFFLISSLGIEGREGFFKLLKLNIYTHKTSLPHQLMIDCCPLIFFSADFLPLSCISINAGYFMNLANLLALQALMFLILSLYLFPN